MVFRQKLLMRDFLHIEESGRLQFKAEKVDGVVRKMRLPLGRQWCRFMRAPGQPHSRPKLAFDERFADVELESGETTCVRLNLISKRCFFLQNTFNPAGIRIGNFQYRVHSRLDEQSCKHRSNTVNLSNYQRRIIPTSRRKRL